MKIQCDVCGKESATVFCASDEAALCHTCDNRVHNANKLASKHPRFSLLSPEFKEFPSCDICQDRQALLFCQEDRALLCRDCDIPIHKANELTEKHNRFLLTGVKLSATASSYEVGTSSTGSRTEQEIKVNGYYQQNSISYCSESASKPYRDSESSQLQKKQYLDSTDNISEYLMETITGWPVEEFLDPSFNYGFCKIRESTRLLILS
ncbi:B-box zinc finger protein 21 [Striga hermonthica]|uniref:B-box zinc finger protein 21 n=1 Tax=Striga hermonthica TaxID=68872 RepID=A0A9N7RH31_STRHE|nr:B-box zinc finger protein 21 [Striga hermonthica]